VNEIRSQGLFSATHFLRIITAWKHLWAKPKSQDPFFIPLVYRFS